MPIACALAAGNTVVYKPSEHTPLEGLVEDLLAEAQIPAELGAGRVRRRCRRRRAGGGEAGQDLLHRQHAHRPQRIMAQAAEQLIPVELELGGKDAMIVFDDATLERAAAGAAWGALTTTGQSCTSVERVYVQRPDLRAVPRRAGAPGRASSCRRVDSDGEADLGAMTTDFQVRDRRRAGRRRQGAGRRLPHRRRVGRPVAPDPADGRRSRRRDDMRSRARRPSGRSSR